MEYVDEPSKAARALPPELDVQSAFDLEMVAGLLRRWSEEILAESLFALGDPRQTESLLTLEPYLRKWEVSPRERSRLRAWAVRPLTNKAVALRSPISFFILRSLSAARERRQGPWRRLRFRQPRPGLPEPFWGVVSEIAWSDPRFQQRVGSLLAAYFRNRLLLPGGALPMPTVSPRTWWVLLDLLAVSVLRQPPDGYLARIERSSPRWIRRRISSLRRFLHRGSARWRFQERLSEIAREQILAQPGWAGFWEQWLIGEVLAANPKLAKDGGDGARQALQVLPLLESPRYRIPKNEAAAPGGQEELGEIFETDWEGQKPDWLDAGTARRVSLEEVK